MSSTTPGASAPPTDLPKSVRALIALVGVAAAVLSFDTLRALAIVCGTPDRIAFLLPVAVDLAAAVATVLWLRARRADVVELARRIAWSTLAASVVGNGLEHYLVAEHVAPHWTLVVAVGAVPAAILGAIVHLAVVATTTPATMVDQPVSSDDTSEVPAAEKLDEPPVEERDQSSTATGPINDRPLSLVDTVREIDARPGARTGERTLAAELGVTRHQVRTARIEIESGLRGVSA